MLQLDGVAAIGLEIREQYGNIAEPRTYHISPNGPKCLGPEVICKLKTCFILNYLALSISSPERLASAVRFRPWPPDSKRLVDDQKHRFSTCRTIVEHSNCVRFFDFLSRHQFPNLACRVSGLCEMGLSQLGVALGRPNVGMPEELRQFVKISATHHVPRCERVPEIMKTAVLDSRQLKDGCEAAHHPSTAYRPR
jgi:hypothetical protein